jgi:hypothetical protein
MLAQQTTRQNLREIFPGYPVCGVQVQSSGKIITGTTTGTATAISMWIWAVWKRPAQEIPVAPETYHPNDRIKAYIVEVNKTKTGPPRSSCPAPHAEFVRKILEHDGSRDLRQCGWRS